MKHQISFSISLAIALSILTTTILSLTSAAQANVAQRSNAAPEPRRYVLTDIALLELLDGQNLEPLMTHKPSGTALISLTESQRQKLAVRAHEHNRCSGHELIAELPSSASTGQALEFGQDVFKMLDLQAKKDQSYKAIKNIGLPVQPSTPDIEIQNAVGQVSEDNLRSHVAFLSKFQTRNHESSEGKRAVAAFKSLIEETLKTSKIPFTVEFISHQSTPMNSIRLRFPGTSKINEIVVAGAHIDSINSAFFGSKAAPGSDDNASGSANILEAARILSQGAQPARTIELYWYAGEEGGLLGSAEIARNAKSSGKKIVGVLQLDMTLYPGSGEFTLGSMTDFTSLEMRDLWVNINRDYIGAKIVDDKCGYGCSDHASWYRNGFPTLMPFESTMKGMNGAIHTEKDIVTGAMSFRHAAMFGKIAVAFLITLSR